MAAWVGSAGDVASAATALGGLLLVFIGSVASGFDSYKPEDRGAVRAKFFRKGVFAFAGFVLALVAAVLALAGKLTECQSYVMWAVGCLCLSFVVVGIAAFLSILEMW